MIRAICYAGALMCDEEKRQDVANLKRILRSISYFAIFLGILLVILTAADAWGIRSSLHEIDCNNVLDDDGFTHNDCTTVRSDLIMLQDLLYARFALYAVAGLGMRPLADTPEAEKPSTLLSGLILVVLAVVAALSLYNFKVTASISDALSGSKHKPSTLWVEDLVAVVIALGSFCAMLILYFYHEACEKLLSGRGAQNLDSNQGAPYSEL